MRLYELECSHGIGHSSGVHGCDGCCAMLTKPATDAERERIIKLLQEELDRERLYGSNDDEDIGTLIGLDIAIDIVKGKRQ